MRWLLPSTVHTVWSLPQPSSSARRSDTSALWSRPRWCRTSPSTPWFGAEAGLEHHGPPDRGRGLVPTFARPSSSDRGCATAATRAARPRRARAGSSLRPKQPTRTPQHVRVVVVEAECRGDGRTDGRSRGLEEVDRRVERAAVGEDRAEELGRVLVVRARRRGPRARSVRPRRGRPGAAGVRAVARSRSTGTPAVPTLPLRLLFAFNARPSHPVCRVPNRPTSPFCEG